MTEQAIGQLVPHASSGLLVSLSTGRIFDPDGLEVRRQLHHSDSSRAIESREAIATRYLKRPRCPSFRNPT